MQEVISLSISANSEESANMIAESIQTFCAEHYEDRIVEWGKYVVIRNFGNDYKIYNDAPTLVFYEDYEVWARPFIVKRV